MFKSEKRRQEDEDSLVPHGMIWYATDSPPAPASEAPPPREEASAPGDEASPSNDKGPSPDVEASPSANDKAASRGDEAYSLKNERAASPGDEASAPSEDPLDESLGATVHYAQLMEMMRRRARAPLEESPEERAGPEPAAVSAPPAPVPWWRIPHPDPEPGVADLPTTPAAIPRPSPLPFPEIEASASPSPGPASSGSQAVTPVNQETKEVKKLDGETKEVKRAEDPSTLAAAIARLNPLPFSEIESPASPSPGTDSSGSRAPTGLNQETKEVKEAEEVVEHNEVKTGIGSQAALDFARSSLAQSRPVAAEGGPLLSETAENAVRERPAPRWKPPRVRIVLSGLPLRIRIVVGRRLSEWKMWNPSATDGTRLRAAMILAAACAVLALVGLSLASHFASRFLPSHSFRSGSTMDATRARPPAPAGSQASQPAAAGSKPGENRKSPTPDAAKTKEEKPSPQASEARPKHRRAKDDDYVAPNTYKYYGK